MLTIADEGLFTAVFSFPELPLPTCLCVRECAEPAAKTSFRTRIHLLQLNRSSLCQTRHGHSLWDGGGPIVLKAAELVKHHTVVKKHRQVLSCLLFFSLCMKVMRCKSLLQRKRFWTYHTFFLICKTHRKSLFWNMYSANSCIFIHSPLWTYIGFELLIYASDWNIWLLNSWRSFTVKEQRASS